MNRASSLLVFVQFACIGWFVFSGRAIASGGWLVMQIVGLLVGAWAIITMGPLKTSIFPEPRQDNALIESGPYRWIRHPMYTAILLCCLALVIERWTMIDILVFIILGINQWFKMEREERLLLEMFPEYEAYVNRTARLIPFLY